MLSLVSRRLLFMLTVTVAIVFFINLGMRMTRNSEVLQPNFALKQQALIAWDDTRSYLANAGRGELGTMRLDNAQVDVKQLLKEAYVNSMGLLLVSLLVATVIGIPLGIFAALTKRSKFVTVLMGVTVIGIAVPTFFAALLWRQAEIYYVYYFGRPLVSIAGFGWDYKHMTLPVLVLAARPLAYLTRASFLGFQRVMHEDYIRTAYSKGVGQVGAVFRHASPNVAVPVLTAVGVSLRFALGALPIVEFFFLWPGMGLRLLEAINSRQTVVVITLAVALGLTFLIVNMLLDMAYRLVDPRIREEIVS